MKKITPYFLCILLLCSSGTKAASIFWIGPSGGAWSNGANWTGGVVPGPNDDVFFGSSVTVDVDISPTVALLWIAIGDVIFSATSDRLITIGNNAAGRFVFLVDVSSTLTLGQGAGVSIQTYGNGASNTATIGYGAILILGEGNSQWIMAPSPASASNCITDIFNQGIVEVAANNTGPVFSGTGTNNLVFSPGSTLNWKRSGGSAPAADFQDGSLINVTGITATNMAFSSSALYNGKLFWNCTGQTISGASATLLPSVSTAMDSIRIISTGTGTLRMTTEPAYTLGHLEVQGGTLELSAPVTGFRTGTISTGLKITGGNLIGNATFAGDGGFHYPMTLTVNGSFTMSGGTFNLTNRPLVPVGPPDGAFQMNVVGHVSQTAGTITATSAFGSQNYISMNGVSTQNLELDNITGPVGLVINNSAGVILQDDVNLPFALVLLNGILTTTAANLLTMAAGSVVPFASHASFVNGPVSKIGNTAFTFPIGKTTCGPSATVNGYAALALTNFIGSAPTDRFTAEYIRGSAYALGAITALAINHISGCDYWTLTRDNGVSTADITLSWDDPINNCITTAPYIDHLPSLTIAHNNNMGGTWDANAVAGMTSGTTTTGSVTWTGVQSTTFGAFAIGSVSFLNPLPVSVNYFNGARQSGNHLLNWKVTCISTPNVTMVLERSTDGNYYNSIYSITATALQCQQPFNYTDVQPAAGINYYRLKMTDANGKITYSSIVSLLNATKGFDIMNIAPNPIVNGNFKLNVSAAQKTQMDIVVTDMQGRIMQKQTVSVIAGFTSIPMNVANLSTGTYQVYGYSADGRSRALRFVIQ